MHVVFTKTQRSSTVGAVKSWKSDETDGGATGGGGVALEIVAILVSSIG